MWTDTVRTCSAAVLAVAGFGCEVTWGAAGAVPRATVVARDARVPIAPARAGESDTKQDMERLQGVWTIASLEIGGDKLPEGTAKVLGMGVGFTFEPEVVTLVGQVSRADGQFVLRDGTQRFRYEIAPTEEVAEIDIETGDQEFAKGIYKFDGDDLILCIDFSRADRPDKFETKGKPAFELYRLRKQK